MVRKKKPGICNIDNFYEEKKCTKYLCLNTMPFNILTNSTQKRNSSKCDGLDGYFFLNRGSRFAIFHE